MTPTTLAKAARLNAEHRISAPVAGLAFHVHGNTGTYVVTIAPGVKACTCPARGECSHVRACVNRLLSDHTERTR